MPLTSFVNSLASKAQSTIQQHIPQARPASPDPAAQPSANEAAAASGHKSHTLEALQHQFRTFQQQYATTTPVQKIITSAKGLAIDLDSTSRDAKTQSKELYIWGQSEAQDLKDVTDRLAYLNFLHGSLAGDLALKLDAARGPFKALRDAETAIAPRRNVRATLNTQLSRAEHEQAKGMERRLVELKEQIAKAESDDAPQEREIELLKRKAVKESEQAKWEALREYGEKLIILSQAAAHITPVLPSIPPSATNPYTGAEATASARASLQRALDNYQPGHIQLPEPIKGADLGGHDTRSFGQTHASELSSLANTGGHSTTSIPMTPPIGTQPLPKPASPSSAAPIDPQSLNQAPAPIPADPKIAMKDASLPSESSAQMSSSSLAISDPSKPIADNTPTLAETGVPLSSSSPGPATGSLVKTETAEEEKKRLEKEGVERAQKAMSGGPEKKDGDEDLPPYQEM